jgi:hypothetical protein
VDGEKGMEGGEGIRMGACMINKAREREKTEGWYLDLSDEWPMNVYID